MRVVAVSMIKNEADIVEAFVRHTATFADHHVIFDHASTDGTRFVLNKLAQEGLPLTLLSDDRVEYLQAERTTAMMRRAVHDHAADWVLPLDADEFPQAANPQALRAVLAAADRPQRLWLRDHAPHPADDPTQINPALRLRHTLAHRTAGKVFVPRSFAADVAYSLAPGNHELMRGGAAVERQTRDDVWIAHFACRSAPQVMAKIILNELQRMAGGTASGGGTHLRRHFQRLLTGPRTYWNNPGAYLMGATCAPAEYWGGPMRYPVPGTDTDRAIAGLLAYAEQLAQSHGQLKDQVSSRGRGWTRWWRRSARPTAPPMREGLTVLESRSAIPAGGELSLLQAEADSRTVWFRVLVRNAGFCLWRAGAVGEPGTVHLGVQLCRAGTVLNPNYCRSPLPADLEPGQSVTLALAVPRPADPDLSLRLDLVAEGVTWFDCPDCIIDLAAGTIGQAA